MSYFVKEEDVWEHVRHEHLWMLDKLILSRYLGYTCGPVGMDVPEPGEYIVRPCVNALGLGFGAKSVWIEKDTDHLPPGHFWCEKFEGQFLSVDWVHGRRPRVIEGIPDPDNLMRFQMWREVDVTNCPAPDACFFDVVRVYGAVNAEYIGGRLIELHFRVNPDFEAGRYHTFIPVWEGDEIDCPEGYWYIPLPELNGRIGAYVTNG